jgi:hypothetical protein
VETFISCQVLFFLEQKSLNNLLLPFIFLLSFSKNPNPQTCPEAGEEKLAR